jgi:ABC-2 type transport system ATP-binding protein
MYRGRIVVCDAPEQIKELVGGDLLELRPRNLRRAQTLVTDLEGVLEVQTYGDLLHVFVDGAEERQAEILAVLEAAGIEIIDLRQIQPRMEEAFISLVRRQRAEASRSDVAEEPR